MELSTPSAWARWLVLFVVILVAGALTFASGKFWLAEHWDHSSNPQNWARAAKLEPGNGAYWYHLGRFRQLDFAQADLQQAIEYYRRALAIDPRSADYWMDLGSSYEMAGDLAAARQSFLRARSVYPISAEVAWRYGNFLSRQGELDEAFAEIRRAVAGDPRLVTLAVSRCWRTSRDIERILQQALPAESDVYLSAVDLLASEHEADAALVVWQRLMALRSSFALKRAFPLLDELTVQRRIEEARRVWQQALESAGLTGHGFPGESLVWDGGFEGEFSNGGFGWRQQDVAGADFDFDSETRHSGARALRVTFDGTANLDFYHLFQFVPVEPRTRYHFTTWLRPQGISTDSGIRFAIFDSPNAAALHLLTSDLVGTEDWVLLEADFTTGPETRLVEIALRRLPSRKFDNQIRGTVWVDDVSLNRVSQEAAPRSP